MENTKIVITGGAGFVGKRLINLLTKKGFKNITVVDTFETKFENVKYIKTDFADEKIIKPILEKTDIFFHLAAMIGVDNCRNHPDLVRQVNYTNTKQLINWALDKGVKRIVFTSSSEVYGNSKDIPYKEDGELEPVSVYGQAKVDIENYLLEAQKKSKMSIGISRLFNVYGPGQKIDFVVSIFINAALSNKPLQIFGTGEQTRTFTYVDDVANGLLKLGLYNKTPYEIVNLGSKEEYSITNLAKMILDLIPESTSQIDYVQYGEEGTRTSNYEIVKRVPSIEKANRILDFEAKTTLREGLLSAIDYLKSINLLQ
ncbi:SDR family oxidoreductase [soil metagenome]